MTYSLLNVLYHALCILGLIWQITQISINFFKFDVNKDINVFMPEEITESDKVLYVCFDNHEVFDPRNYNLFLRRNKVSRINPFRMPVASYRKKFLDKMTVQQRFNVTISKSTLVPLNDPVDDFIIGNSYCVQIRNATLLYFNWESLNAVTSISVSMGQELPMFDKRRQKLINEFGLRNGTIKINVRSYWYSIVKLSWPYSDNCIDYRVRHNQSSRFGAIVHCENMRAMGRKMLSNERIVRRQSKYSNYSISTSNNPLENQTSCWDIYKQLDCSHAFYLTQVSRPLEYTFLTPSLIFSKDIGQDPSFLINSKPRIDNIDFVTYILGALGAWIGFSFIAINPVPYFLKIDGAESMSNGDSTLRREVIRSRNILIAVQRELLVSRKDRERLTAENISLKRDMEADRRKYGKMMRQLYSKICDSDRN